MEEKTRPERQSLDKLPILHEWMKDGEALHTSDVLLERVLDASPAGIVVFKAVRNSSGQIIDFEWLLVNAAAARIIGRPRGDLIGKRMTEELPGTLTDGLFENYVCIVETGQPLEHEHYYAHDRIDAWFYSIGLKLDDGFVITFSDITERKRAEDHLQRRNRDLAMLNRVITEAASTFDLDKIMAIICHELALVFDAPQVVTALLNRERNAYVIMAEEVREGYSPVLGARFLVQENPVSYSMRQYRGPVVLSRAQFDLISEVMRRTLPIDQFESIVVLPLPVQEELAGVIGIGCDHSQTFDDEYLALATNMAAALSQALYNVHLYQQLEVYSEALEQRILDQQRTEEALRHSQERYRLLADNSADVIWMLGLDGRFSYVSPSVERLRGYTPEEVLEQTLQETLTPESYLLGQKEIDNIWRLKWEGTKNTQRRRLELEQPCKDGSTVWTEVIASPMYDENDELIGILGVTRDISERKSHEAQREQLITELDAFAHTVAHDLQNPLSGIAGYTTLLLEDLSTLSPDDQYSYLQRIEKNSAKMSLIIDNLLLLSSVRELDEVPLQPVDSVLVVADVLIRLDHMITEYQAEVIWSPDGWPSALGYEPWVEEIWANYVSNAIKYGGQPPRIELGAESLPGDQVRFWVRDNGQGIAPEDQARLFTQFTRLHEAKIKGHGLGLSIVRRIVEKLGGEAGVHSQPGQGCLFYFLLRSVP